MFKYYTMNQVVLPLDLEASYVTASNEFCKNYHSTKRDK